MSQYKIDKHNIQNFKRNLEYVKVNAVLAELSMHYSPKAFKTTQREHSPIMMGWEWEHTAKRALASAPATDIIKTILNSPLGEYINLRYEVSDLEVVSIPTTLLEHKRWMNNLLFKKDVKLFDLAGKITTNRGIHIHIDKRSFTKEALNNFIVFISHPHNTKFIKYIAGRDVYNVGWCTPHKINIIKNKNKIQIEKLHINEDLDFFDQEGEKSCAVNVMSRFNTVELRIFKTTKNKNVMFRNLEFADALVRFCRVHTDEELTFKDFLVWLFRPINKARYPILTQDKRIHKFFNMKERNKK